jgi:hypothetical protein
VSNPFDKITLGLPNHRPRKFEDHFKADEMQLYDVHSRVQDRRAIDRVAAQQRWHATVTKSNNINSIQ